METISILTRNEADAYQDYIAKIKAHPLARRVKLADLRDNMRIDRIANPSKEDFARLEKYKKALSFLESN